LKRILYILFSLSLLLNACNSNKTESITQIRKGFSLENINDSLSFIVLLSDSLVDKWELPYPVYQFQIGDIDEDGDDDLIVGVIKTTRFDSTLAKRIFIFKNYHGYVRPMWLGSKLSKPLIDFRFYKSKDGSRIKSIEKEKEGKYLVAEYKWRKFGLEFIQYIEREVSIEQAQKTLIK